MSNRVEFTTAVKGIIAGRAGYRCSMPTCRAMTIGPGHTVEEIALTGTACHIFSASSGGPRGQGGLSPEQLRHPSNGIWLCETHGKLVDTNDGDAYPASLLISLRNLHEAWVAREQGGISEPFGWVQQLEFLGGPVFASPSVINLGKVTLIAGRNGTGKTALCEWLIGATEPSVLWRWFRWSKQSLRYRVKYYAPIEHKVLVAVNEEEVLYLLDDRAVPYNPLPFRVVTLSEPEPDWGSKTDLQQISELLNIDSVVVRNVLRRLDPGNPIVRNAQVESGEVVRLDVAGTHPGLRWASLSGGEQIIVAVELAIMMADLMAKFHPTVLILDWGISRLDNAGLAALARRLSSPEIGFQSIVVSLERRGMVWDGWQTAKLIGSPPEVVIEQEDIL